MATNIETMWVGDAQHLQRTVQNLVERGGVVQAQSDTEVTLYIKKKINVPVLVVGLILCLVPGLAYLIWYLSADQNQLVTVKVGTPDTIRTEHQHWYDSDGAPRPEATGATAADAAAGTPVAEPPAAATPPGLGAADPATAVPPMPAAPDPAPAFQPPPAPPAPPTPPPGGSSF